MSRPIHEFDSIVKSVDFSLLLLTYPINILAKEKSLSKQKTLTLEFFNERDSNVIARFSLALGVVSKTLKLVNSASTSESERIGVSLKKAFLLLIAFDIAHRLQNRL